MLSSGLAPLEGRPGTRKKLLKTSYKVSTWIILLPTTTSSPFHHAMLSSRGCRLTGQPQASCFLPNWLPQSGKLLTLTTGLAPLEGRPGTRKKLLKTSYKVSTWIILLPTTTSSPFHHAMLSSRGCRLTGQPQASCFLPNWLPQSGKLLTLTLKPGSQQLLRTGQLITSIGQRDPVACRKHLGMAC